MEATLSADDAAGGTSQGARAAPRRPRAVRRRQQPARARGRRCLPREPVCSRCGCPRSSAATSSDRCDSLEVLALTSYGDPSAGWVQMAASLAIGTAGSYLGETAIKDLFGERPLPGDRRPGHGARPRRRRSTAATC